MHGLWLLHAHRASTPCAALARRVHSKLVYVGLAQARPNYFYCTYMVLHVLSQCMSNLSISLQKEAFVILTIAIVTRIATVDYK